MEGVWADVLLEMRKGNRRRTGILQSLSGSHGAVSRQAGNTRPASQERKHRRCQKAAPPQADYGIAKSAVACDGPSADRPDLDFTVPAWVFRLVLAARADQSPRASCQWDRPKLHRGRQYREITQCHLVKAYWPCKNLPVCHCEPVRTLAWQSQTETVYAVRLKGPVPTW